MVRTQIQLTEQRAPRFRGRLLVIDDDVGTIETFGLVLRKAGFESEGALTATEGLAALRSIPNDNFDLVLLDLRLPDVYGLEVLADIQLHGPALPTVMVSAWWSDAAIFAARRLGAAEIIAKPLDNDAVVAVVSRNLIRSAADPMAQSTIETGYATRRWVDIMLSVVLSREDVPTLAIWARLVGESVSTLKGRCAAVHTHAGDALDLARVLRVVRNREGQLVDWSNALDVLDLRTLDRILHRAGVSHGERVPVIETLLARQSFLRPEPLLSALAARLARG